MRNFLNRLFGRKAQSADIAACEYDVSKEAAVNSLLRSIAEQMIRIGLNGSDLSKNQELGLLGYSRGYTDVLAKFQFPGDAGAEILLFLKVNESLGWVNTDPRTILDVCDALIQRNHTAFQLGLTFGTTDAVNFLKGKEPDSLSKLLSEQH